MRLFKKAKVTISSFLLWILSIAVFLGNAWLFQPKSGFYSDFQSGIFLVAMVIGSISFIVFCVFFFFTVWRKSKALAILIVLLVMLVPALGGSYLYGVVQTNNVAQQQAALIPNFTGQDIFNAVNRYRVANGVNEIKLDPVVCNNLAQRYFDIKKGISEGVAHKNFKEWVQEYIPSNYYISEDFTQARTPEEAIKQWEGSPGHRLSILDKKATLGCSYAAEGYAIMLLGYRNF